MSKPKKQDQKKLEFIRKEFDRYTLAWKDIREEGKKDMHFVAADTWTDEEKTKRAGRPCFDMDELGQYINQLVNTVRQNPLGIKVVPIGDGANDETAALRQGKIRDIEYESSAQSAYASTFQSAAERSYGFARVISIITDPASFDHDLRVQIIPNPDTVLLDPDAKQPDCSDGRGAFIIDTMPEAIFKQEFKNAEIKDFSDDMKRDYSSWIKDDGVQVAEWFEKKREVRTLLLYGDEAAPQKGFLDEIDGAKIDGEELIIGQQRFPILKQRDAEQFTVCCYKTNGVEILDYKEEDPRIQFIPIIPMFGKQYYRDKGSGSKRVIESFIRKARIPQKLFNYACSQEAEEFQKSPQAPRVGYRGQFTDPNWKSVTPVQYLEVEYMTDASGQTPLPIPVQTQFTPNFQEYEIAKQSLRQSIQAAIGYYNASIGKHDTNAKSGIAIKQLEGQSDTGSFHFIDNYKRFIEHVGRVLDERLDVYYDGTRETGFRSEDGTHENKKINIPHGSLDEKGQPLPPEALNNFGVGKHKVTLSTGPSYDSQREASMEFGKELSQNPNFASKIIDLVILDQNLGPRGEEMADRLRDPQYAKPGSPQQLQAQVAQLNQHNQLLTQELQKASQALETKQVEQQGKVETVKAQEAAKVEIEQIRAQNKLDLSDKDRETKLAVAEVMTQSQDPKWREQLVADLWKAMHDSAHDSAMQAADQAHEKEMQLAEQTHEQGMQANQQDAAAEAQESQQGHEADQASQAQDAAAEQQPEPEAVAQ